MAGLAGNLLKLSYKNLTNATIYRYQMKLHVFNHATAIMKLKTGINSKKDMTVIKMIAMSFRL